MKGVKKQHLPTKTCLHCGRPFAWRKKWERDWEQVRYCSDACRRGRPLAAGGARLLLWLGAAWFLCVSTLPAAAPMPAFSVFPGQGSGAVVSDATIRPMQGPGSPASIFASRPVDLQGTGRPDLVLCHGVVPPAAASRQPIRILRPQADGSLLDVTRLLLGDGELPGAVAPRVIVEGDFNEDGRVDLFVACQGWDANPFPGEVNVLLLSRPDGTYADASANLPQQPDFTHDAAAGDIDGDGHLDLYVGNVSGQQSVGPYFLLGRGDGTFARTTNGLPALIASTTEKFTASGIVDLDGDASPDLVLGTHGDGGFLDSIVLFNDGTGDFTVRPRLVLPDGPLGRGNTVVQGVGVIDINRDGRPDLILPSSQYSTFTGLGLQVLINQGNGVLVDESAARLGSHAARFTNSPFQAPRFADLNGDGLTDFLFSNGPVEPVPRYFLAESDGTFTAVAPDLLPPGIGFGVSAVHFDGDGWIDLVEVSHNPQGDIFYQSYRNRKNQPIIGTPPVFTLLPGSVTKPGGTSSLWEAYATGSPEPTHEWRKNGVAIPGATGPTLPFPSHSFADAGTYSVVVSNSAGSVESPPWTLIVTDTYANWRLRMFTPEELADPSRGGDSARSPVDGLPNLVRYALGADRSPVPAAALPSITSSASEWIVAYTRPAGAGDVGYVVEVSDDLERWSTVTIHERIASSPGFETWHARHPRGIEPRLYFRLLVTR